MKPTMPAAALSANLRSPAHPLAAFLLATLLALQLACASVDTPWPAQVVALEQLRPLVPMRSRWLSKNPVDRTLPPVTVVLHVHIDADGRPLRLRLAQSSGNPQQDEAAMATMRAARFAPYRGADGVVGPVTLVAALNYPQEKADDKGLRINR